MLILLMAFSISSCTGENNEDPGKAPELPVKEDTLSFDCPFKRVEFTKSVEKRKEEVNFNVDAVVKFSKILKKDGGLGGDASYSKDVSNEKVRRMNVEEHDVRISAICDCLKASKMESFFTETEREKLRPKCMESINGYLAFLGLIEWPPPPPDIIQALIEEGKKHKNTLNRDRFVKEQALQDWADRSYGSLSEKNKAKYDSMKVEFGGNPPQLKVITEMISLLTYEKY